MKTSAAACSNTAFWQERTLPLRDAIELLSGKWKICIIQNLTIGALRFKDLHERVRGISPKVLSKELQDLEQNQLVTRTVNDTRPVTVSYALTEHADAIQPVLDALIEFGSKHRKMITGK
ncbi:transcriptional regulator [Pedobacter yulinensis]|uniref:Transcriptional regulator n=1 Tax=Pedobacter yulinensis TaxID=2126353 RepID=A0A2T3HJT8_9SPHI|nr:helix-turn-helix domain-containing protein [Pedobacter yulinensis]PST82700.1 transcriptional regulator [Pedobacter yulinensis]